MKVQIDLFDAAQNDILGAKEYPGVQFVVLYHPAYLLYNPRKKKVMWEHVKKLDVFLKENLFS